MFSFRLISQAVLPFSLPVVAIHFSDDAYCFPDKKDRISFEWNNGYRVEVKEDADPCGPWYNYFRRENVVSDGTSIKLVMKQTDVDGGPTKEWSGAEVRVLRPEGAGPYTYGKFEWEIGSVRVVDADDGRVVSERLPANVVLGLFTWDPNDDWTTDENWNHEVAVDVRQFSDPNAPDVRFKVLPNGTAEEDARFYSGPDASTGSYAQSNQVHAITWNPGHLRWESTAGGGQTKTYSSDYVIGQGWTDNVQCLPSTTEVRMNLFIDRSVEARPMNLSEESIVEVTIEKFSYEESGLHYIPDGSRCSKDCQCEVKCGVTGRCKQTTKGAPYINSAGAAFQPKKWTSFLLKTVAQAIALG
mmetsp:Transcript_14685/g.28099  ORF Transcript_14685/g.28099 Transcript_14685/m.28099 type:complete len:357 (-) Transcript_14685:117-1187(-)|eukprot:CAMPEP_0197444654 /NCGR_PEP_ID=MMETSP1175-20131217/10085_1 /TAXON_ID=1003142 /ORGANISM="Triceratium dubium, Strain CCMP147" /LENGTH=356 /DNA_ID=CAMNT_0042975481 /DNA_START=240 /DNA_END=1310 /DNA_ORIENTATION=+